MCLFLDGDDSPPEVDHPEAEESGELNTDSKEPNPREGRQRPKFISTTKTHVLSGWPQKSPNFIFTTNMVQTQKVTKVHELRK